MGANFRAVGAKVTKAETKTKTITVQTLEKLGPENHGERLRDKNGIIGEVRAGVNGVSVYFSLRYKFEGKAKEKRLGTWPKKGLKEIRDEAKTLLGEIAQKLDPIEQGRIEAEAVALQTALKEARNENLKAELEAMRAGLTISELANMWITQDRATAAKDKGAEVRRSFEKDLLPTLGKVLAKDVTRPQIVILLDKVKARSPSISRYLLSDMRAMFKWAILRGYLESDPTYLLELKKYARKNERERVLSIDEIKELATALPAAQLPVHTEQAVWLMLATCCRVGEISKAKWSHIDLEKGTWTIPEGNAKNSKELVITLSPFAIERFKTIKQHQKDTKTRLERSMLPEYVCPSDGWTSEIDSKAIGKQIRDRQRETPLKGRSKTANTALILSTGKPWTPHDLRRTGATLMRSLGVDSDVIEQCLNHKKKETLKRIYQRTDFTAEMGRAWASLGEHLDLLKSGHSNVVVLNTGT